jgi:Family of unknown function (DUF6350)
VTTSAARASNAGSGDSAGAAPAPPGGGRPLVATGAIGAGAAAAAGLAVLTMVVLVGWIAAPHAGLGLTGVLRTAAVLWLIGHHVGFSLHGAGRIGMLPLGLVLLPGALLWRAGRWVVRAGGVSRLRHVGYAALALAMPYALVAGALAVASRSAQAAPSALQAVVCGFLLALVAGGLGGARALAPWAQLTRLLPDRPRSVIIGVVGALAVLTVCGAVLAGASLGAHLGEYATLSRSLEPGAIGSVLLLVTQVAYVPNAILWAVAFTLGPGFAFGTGTIVSPTGAALGQLPAFPLLAALPPGMHSGSPVLAVAVLALPYVAGCVAGLLLVRAAPTPALEMAPLWGLACGVAAGGVLGVLAAFSGGPLGDGRLAAVGPSGWQVGAVAALEIGIASAVTAGVANWLRMGGRLRPGGVARAASEAGPAGPVRLPRPRSAGEDADGGHTIYLDPWAGDAASGPSATPRGPSSLP